MAMEISLFSVLLRTNEVMDKCFRALIKFLEHQYPKIRDHTAQEIVKQLNQYPVGMKRKEEAMKILTSTNWLYGPELERDRAIEKLRRTI